jgi:trk system potassium uptake protein
VEKAGKPIRFGSKVLVNLSLLTLRPIARRLAESNKALIPSSVSGELPKVGLRHPSGTGGVDAMQVIVMGCGRVGISVALELQAQGHQVTVIDRDQASFRGLPANFQGKTVRGVGFDLDTLREAGIENADAFIAVSSGDNSNIISARVAREKFKIKRVIARIYDPRRAEIYGRLGIPTIASVAWSTQQIIGLLKQDTPTILWSDANDAICISTITVPDVWVSKLVSDVEASLNIKAISIQRATTNLLADAKLVLQQGDRIAFAHTSEMQDEIMAKLTNLVVS